MTKYLTTEEVATILRLKGAYRVVELCREGTLRATRPGGQWLIAPADLDAYIASGSNQPQDAA
jgi:excisionase family DNA binding protein